MHFVLRGVGLLGVSLDLLHGLLEFLQLLDGVILQLVVHVHGALQVLVICLQLLLCIDGGLLLFSLLIQLGLQISQLLGQTSPLLLPSLLLGGEVALKLGLEGLHVHLQPHLLILGLLELVLQLLQLGLLLVQLLLQLALGFLQLVDVLVGRALGVDQVVQLNLQASSCSLALVKAGLDVLDGSVQVQELRLLLPGVPLGIVSLSGDPLRVQFFLGQDLVEVPLLLLELHHLGPVSVQLNVGVVQLCGLFFLFSSSLATCSLSSSAFFLASCSCWVAMDRFFSIVLVLDSSSSSCSSRCSFSCSRALSLLLAASFCLVSSSRVWVMSVSWLSSTSELLLAWLAFSSASLSWPAILSISFRIFPSFS